MAQRAETAWKRGTRSRVAGVMVAAGTVLTVGCSGSLDDVLPERKPAYKSSRSTTPLEVPPDLAGTALQDSLPIAEGDATGSQFATEAQAQPDTGVLPEVEDVRIGRSGQERWLVVTAAPESVWPKIRNFWIDQGFSLASETPDVGVMETDWAEKRTPLPAGMLKGFVNRLSDSFYGVSHRDRYRTRLERGIESGTTEVYISHRGAEQIVVGDETPDAQREGLGERVWQIRPNDPGLEAEMLARLMIFLGVDEARATALATESVPEEPRAQIVRDANGTIALSVREGFSPAWRRVGLALDRAGFTVEDRDRSRGVYFLRYAAEDTEEQEGWLSRLKFWGSDDSAGPEPGTYLVNLVEEGSDTTRVVVLDQDGEREMGTVGERILTVLHELLE